MEIVDAKLTLKCEDGTELKADNRIIQLRSEYADRQAEDDDRFLE